jgi:hypothetical protein
MTDFKPTPEMLAELRKAQWRAALKGSVPMLILLGREYLGQTTSLAKDTEAPRETVIVLEW